MTATAATQTAQTAPAIHPTLALPLATEQQIADARALGAAVPPSAWGVEIVGGPKVLATWFDLRGRKQAAYSAAAVEARAERKFGAMLAFGEQIPNIRRAVAADLRSADERVRACAAVVAIIDQTTMRIGSAAYSAENETYGASSLLKSHLSFKGKCAVFSFTGKHHVEHRVTVTGADLLAALRGFAADAHGEKLFPVNETQVRAYLGAFGVSPKQFRTYHATRIAAQMLEAAGAPANEAAAKKIIATTCKAVAAVLGNTPAMARASYINPAILADYAAQIAR